jgi:hypothetical protein
MKTGWGGGKGWWAALVLVAACGGSSGSPGEEAPWEPGAGTPPEAAPASPSPAPALWAQQYGGQGAEQLQALASDSAGGFVAGGLWGDSPFPHGTGFALARYTSAGLPVWVRQVSTEEVQVSALTVTPEGHILAVGQYRGAPHLGTGVLPEAGAHSGTGAFPGIFVAKFSPTGETTWSQGFVASHVEPQTGERRAWSISADAVATDAHGSLIVLGNFHGEVDFGTGMLSAGGASTAADDPSPGSFVAKFTGQGQPVWSRAFTAQLCSCLKPALAVATDAAGHVLVGGWAHAGADLGDGPLPAGAPFIAKYSPEGGFLWKRLFHKAFGAVTHLQALGTHQVVFNASLRETFLFGGQPHTGGDPRDRSPSAPDSAYTGMLSAQGEDQWLVDHGDSVLLHELVAGDDGTVTLAGQGPGEEATGTSSNFLARYSDSGHLLKARSLPRNLEGGAHASWPFLAPQPGGAVVVAGHFSGVLRYDGLPYVSQGATDLFCFNLLPD